MPRYFFHIQNGRDFIDEDGEVLVDDAAARVAAVRTLGELVQARQQGWAHADGALTLTVERDTDGPVILLRAEIAALAP